MSMHYFNGSRDLQKPKKVRKGRVSQAVTVFSVICITLSALLCLLPFLMMVSASFSDENIIMTQGISLFPRGFSTAAYSMVMKNPRYMIGSYIVTILLTSTGTITGLFIISMTGEMPQIGMLPKTLDASFRKCYQKL